MASQVSPGIVIRERDLTNAVVTGVQQIRAAHVSSFAKGPVGEIVNINSQKELVTVFGEPSDSNAEDWMVANEFLNYGGRLAVVRAASGVDNATTGAAGILIRTVDDWKAGAGTGEVFAARTAGSHGNGLMGVLVDRGADYIITLAGAPSNVTVAVGDTVAFSGGVGGKVVDADGLNLTITADGALTTGNTLTDGGDTVALSAVKDWYLNTTIGSTGIKLSAIAPRPGTSAYAADNGAADDEIHFAVIDTTGALTGTANTIVERLTYLSKLSDGKSSELANVYYKTVINDASSHLFHGSSISTDANMAGAAWDQTAAAAGGALARSGVYNAQLNHGSDDYAYDTSEFGAGMDLFNDTEETDIDFVLMGGSMASETDTKAKATKVIGLAAARKDAIAFVSPHKGNQIVATGNVALSSTQQKENTLAFFSGMTSTSYAVLDSGYKYMYDRWNDKYRYIPCNGDVAGLCVATSASLDDWYSPAGLNRGGILNAVKLAYNPNKADRDELYQNRINPITSLRGQGITLFGDKTALASPSAFDRINVRRLFLNLEKRARRLAEGVLFEQNDATTRAGFSAALNGYLSEVQARRGVTDYLVVCDETNNTAEVIDRNEFVAEVYVKPTRSINYITVTFTATKSGVSFSEVVGR